MKKFLKIIGVLIGIPLMLYIIFIISTIIIGSYGMKHEISKIIVLVVYGAAAITELICIIILFIIYSRNDEGLIKRCSFKKFEISKLPTILCLTLGYYMLELGSVYLVGGISKIHHTKTLEFISLIHQSFLEFIGIIILITIFEEIIFRGVIFVTLKRNLNVIAALILQALVFSIANFNMNINLVFSMRNISIVSILNVVFLGIILGVVFLYTESLLGSIICHMIINLLGILIITPTILYFYYSPIVIAVIGVILLALSLFFYKKNKKLSVNHN